MVLSQDIISLIQESRVLRLNSDLKTNIPLTYQGLDSLDIIALFYEIERKYNVKVPSEGLSKLQSLDDITVFLNSNFPPTDKDV